MYIKGYQVYLPESSLSKHTYLPFVGKRLFSQFLPGTNLETSVAQLLFKIRLQERMIETRLLIMFVFKSPGTAIFILIGQPARKTPNIDPVFLPFFLKIFIYLFFKLWCHWLTKPSKFQLYDSTGRHIYFLHCMFITHS